MRISGGEWRSRRVAGPPARSPVRPTPDALREQAFAVLGASLAGAVFLDLFAGTGVNSLEALSRGATRAVLVDDSPAAAALIRRNLAALGVEEARWELVVRPAGRAVRELAERGLRPGVVWCDPPFAEWELGPDALARALDAGLLAPGARVVLELPPRRTAEIPGLAVARELRGAVLLRVAGLGTD
ncbi:MAG TPA: RsmD family RNA methyltransferase [Thermoanaerobaculaceae bacterium]|nr:RsmD family RNA methyltransferase [Thermoanaerobaculaceae bacterium]